MVEPQASCRLFTLLVNSDDIGTYTNGHIALLDLAMSTPTTAAESTVPNHVMLTCSSGHHDWELL